MFTASEYSIRVYRVKEMHLLFKLKLTQTLESKEHHEKDNHLKC